MDKETHSDPLVNVEPLVIYKQTADYLHRLAAELKDAPNTSLSSQAANLHLAARQMTTLITLVNTLLREREL